MINQRVVFNMDWQRSREEEHDNDLFWKDCPRWDSVDLKQSLINIRKYFTNKAPCSHVLCPHIAPLVHKNQETSLWRDPNMTMIERYHSY